MPNNELRPFMGRRTFSQLMGIAPLVLLAACNRPRANPHVVPPPDYPTPQPLPGRKLESGTFVDWQELVQLYLDAITTDLPVLPDPTIFKTTAQLTMELNGLSPEIAMQRADNIRIVNSTEIGTTAAARTTSNSGKLGILLSEDAFDHSRPGQNPSELRSWQQVLWLTSHEATHTSPDAVDDTPSTEDLGPLGKMKIKGNRYGFFADETYEGNGPNLIQFGVRYVQDGPIETMHPIEEITGEIGRINFMTGLGAMGLDQVGITPEYINDIQPAYRFLRQAVVDVYDPVWNEYTSGVLSPTSFMEYHQDSNRSGFHYDLGAALAKQNKHSPSLSEEAIRGLGALGFAAFVHVGEKDKYTDTRPVLTALREEPITPDLLVKRSYDLVKWIADIYDLTSH